MIKEAIAFCVGAAAGAIGVKLYLDTKYQTQVQEEIDAMREAYEKKYNEKTSEKEETEEKKEEDNRLNHSAPIRDREDLDKLKTNYHDITNAYTKVVKDDPNNDPVIITPEEYADADEKYATENLDYYAEDDIVMSGDEEISNIDELVGKENMDEFKRSDEEAMYVRNDLFMIMYEVCKA